MKPFACVRLVAVAGPTKVSAKIQRLVPFPSGTEYAPSPPSQPCWQGKYAAEAHAAFPDGGDVELVEEPPQESKRHETRKWLRPNTACPFFISSPSHFPIVPVHSDKITDPTCFFADLAAATATDQLPPRRIEAQLRI
jgi:hypothetical protein